MILLGWIAAALCLVVDLFQVRRKSTLVLMGALFATAPMLAFCNAGYFNFTDIFMCAFFLSVLSVWLMWRFRWEFLAGAVCLVGLLAMYQSFMASACGLVTMLFILQALDGCSGCDHGGGVRVTFTNMAYMRKQVEFESTVAAVNRIVSTMEQTDGYEVGKTPVAWVGGLSATDATVYCDGLGELRGYGLSGSYAIGHYRTIQPFFTYVMGSSSCWMRRKPPHWRKVSR